MIRITNLSKMYGATHLEPLPAEAGGQPGTRPPTLLVVEDDPTMRLAMACMLADDDRQVVTAASAEEALVNLPLVDPDLIVCDYVLAGMNGREFCTVLKSAARWCQVPVIMVTGLDIPAVLADLLANGADEVHTKPVRPDALRSSVQQRLCAATRVASPARSGRAAGAVAHVAAPVLVAGRQFQPLVEL